MCRTFFSSQKRLRIKLLFTLCALALDFPLNSSNKALATGSSSDATKEISKAFGTLAVKDKNLTLTRQSDGKPLPVRYAQKLIQEIDGKRIELDLGLEKKGKSIARVRDASARDKGNTHLLAQGFCKTAKRWWFDTLTTSEFPFDSSEKNPSQKVEWVSCTSTAVSSQHYYIRRKLENLA